ncbi:MAG: hypothetical protein SWQ30_16480 [Thermodesulfobacteriota bacterium]|nr:hypothetical protein [Thermodesulfobacteriota bacterium]
MEEADPGLVDRLSERFRVLEELRVRLWEEYLKVQGQAGPDVTSGRRYRRRSEREDKRGGGH